MSKRKIFIVVASRANYGRVKSVLKAIKDHPKLELHLIVGASTLLYRFGRAVDFIKADGFEPVRSIYYAVEGENLNTQAKSTGLGIIELASAFGDLKPDVVVTVADRFESYAEKVKEELKKDNIRIEVDARAESVGYKVREAQSQKIPIIINVGEKEEKNGTVAIRSLDNKVHFNVKVNDLIKKIKDNVEKKEEKF